jgi:hypothetical protein
MSVRRLLVTISALVVVIVLGAPALAVTGSLNAVIEPLGPTPTKQQFNASWSGLGTNPYAYVWYDDGSAQGGPWYTSSGTKTVYHTYPCVTTNVTRNPFLSASGGNGGTLTYDAFTQLKTYSNGICPPLPGGGEVDPSS